MKHLPILAAALLLSVTTAGMATEIGSTVPAFKLEDANRTEVTVGPSVRRIYANAGRDSDKLIDAALSELKQAALDAQSAIVIAEISAAPFLIKSIIRSSLKDRPYTTWVDTSGQTRKAIPYQKGRVTVLDLDDMQITAIQFIDNVDALKAALSKNPAKSTIPPSPDTPPTAAADAN